MEKRLILRKGQRKYKRTSEETEGARWRTEERIEKVLSFTIELRLNPFLTGGVQDASGPKKKQRFLDLDDQN